MARLRLHPSDRERLGCPEFLPLDVLSVTNREAIALAEQGYPTPQSWRRALGAKQAADSGDLSIDYQAWTALVWLALRRSGVETDPATLEFSVEFEYLADPEPVAAAAVVPGKAPARARSKTSPRRKSTSTAT